MNLTKALQNILLSVKEGYKLNIFYRLTPYVREMIEEHEKLMGNENERYKIVKDARGDFFKKNEEEGHYFFPEIYFFLKGPPYTYKRQGLFRKSDKFLQMTLEEYQNHKEGFLKERKKVKNLLDLAGLYPNGLTKDSWFSLLFSYFNLSRFEKVGSPKFQEDDGLWGESLSEQIALTDVGIEKDFLKIGHYFFKIISLVALPVSMTYASMANGLLGLPFHFWVLQNIVIHNQAGEIDKLNTQRRLAHSFSQGAEKVSDIESESKLFQIEELLGELAEGSDRIVSSAFSVVVWDKSKDEVEEKADEVLATFREMNQAEGLKEDYGGLDAFLKIFLGL